MTEALQHTGEPPKRKRRPYVGRNGVPAPEAAALVRKGEKAKTTATHPRTEPNVASAALNRLAVIEQRLAEYGVVRTRLEWAALPEHVSEYPEHVGLCEHCGERFDRFVNPATGVHHAHRGADYCSDTCQDAAKQARAKARTERYVPGEYMQPRQDELPTFPLPELRAVLNKVRVELATGYGVFVSPLYRREWALLEGGAPTVADRLHYFDSLSEAQSRGAVGLTRFDRERAETLRTELVADIDDWFVNNH